jgi:branched-subunit amino acid aminotransferase/4-amino-4-deoxychorismate lyase
MVEITQGPYIVIGRDVATLDEIPLLNAPGMTGLAASQDYVDLQAMRHYELTNAGFFESHGYDPTQHADHYGSIAFEGIVAVWTKDGLAILQLPQHVSRLGHTSHLLRMTTSDEGAIAFGRQKDGELVAWVYQNFDEIKQLIMFTAALNGRYFAKLNGNPASYIRPDILRGPGGLGVDPLGNAPIVTIISQQWGNYIANGALFFTWIRRGDPARTVTDGKIGGLYSVGGIAKADASDRSCGECLVLAHDGNVSETNGSNLGIVVLQGTEPVIITPDPKKAGQLDSTVMRAVENEIAPSIPMQFLRQDMPLTLVQGQAVGMFATGTAAGIVPITEIVFRLEDYRMLEEAGMVYPLEKEIERKHAKLDRITIKRQVWAPYQAGSIFVPNMRIEETIEDVVRVKIGDGAVHHTVQRIMEEFGAVKRGEKHTHLLTYIDSDRIRNEDTEKVRAMTRIYETLRRQEAIRLALPRTSLLQKAGMR